MAGAQLFLEVPATGRAVKIPMEKGGVQGGVMTPDDWNDLIEDCLETLVEEWEKEGVGVSCGQAGRLSHLVWADNIWLFARTREELERMQVQLTDRLEEKGLWWKDTSLKVMGTEGPKGDMVTTGRQGNWTHKEVDRMEVLGVMLDVRGSTEASMSHREEIAEKVFYALRATPSRSCGRGARW